MAFQMTDIIPALPEIFLSGLALVLVLVAAFGGEEECHTYNGRVVVQGRGGVVGPRRVAVPADYPFPPSYQRHVVPLIISAC